MIFNGKHFVVILMCTWVIWRAFAWRGMPTWNQNTASIREEWCSWATPSWTSTTMRLPLVTLEVRQPHYRPRKRLTFMAAYLVTLWRLPTGSMHTSRRRCSVLRLGRACRRTRGQRGGRSTTRTCGSRCAVCSRHLMGIRTLAPIGKSIVMGTLFLWASNLLGMVGSLAIGIYS